MSTQRERLREGSRKRREHEKEELQRAIVQTAADLFQDVGYQGFSMRQVSERLGYSVATLYLYYANKDELILAAVEEAFLQLDRQMMAVAASTEDVLERLRALFETYVQFGIEHSTLYSLMFLDRPDFLLRPRQGEPDTDVAGYRVLFSAIQEAMETGHMLPGELHQYSDALWAQAHGIVALAIRMPLFFDKERAQSATTLAIETWLAGGR